MNAADHNRYRERSARVNRSAIADGMLCFTITLFPHLFCILSERRFRRDVGYPERHFPTNEQHGGAPGLSMALVHHLPRRGVLVLHSRLVVSQMIAQTDTSLLYLWIYIVGLLMHVHRTFILPYTLLCFHVPGVRIYIHASYQWENLKTGRLNRPDFELLWKPDGEEKKAEKSRIQV